MIIEKFLYIIYSITITIDSIFFLNHTRLKKYSNGLAIYPIIIKIICFCSFVSLVLSNLFFKCLYIFIQYFSWNKNKKY